MKFLLVAVNAKYIHSNPAVYSLRGALPEEKRGAVELAEYTINQNTEEILADIYQRKPDIIGFSCYIWNIGVIRELLSELPKLLPDVPVWLGGPEVSYNAETLLAEFPAVTGVMVGEGEGTFAELFSYYEGEAELTKIAGLFLRSGFTGEREPVVMEKLPFLYEQPERFENRIIYYEAQRGCPFRCSYCLSSIEKTVRQKKLETVYQELAVFLEHRVAQVKFVDRTFNCREDFALAIWKFLAGHDNGVTNFHFEIAADRLTEAQLAVLKTMRPGLIQLEIGVQTTNPDTLAAICRKTDLERLSRNVREIYEFHNIHQHLDLIAGLPLEGYASFAASFNWVYALRPNQLQLGFLKVLHGSQMEKDAPKYGICYRDTPPYEVLYTDALSYAELCRLKKIEKVLEVYYNSNQFCTTLKFLEGEFASPFAMFEELADFYEAKGYFVRQPARVFAYQALLEFVEEVLGEKRDKRGKELGECSGENEDSGEVENVEQRGKAEKSGKEILGKGAEKRKSEKIEFYKECLIFDLYLRENLRSRPGFAKDLTEYKEEFRQIYVMEEKEQRLLPACAGWDSKQLARRTHIEPFFYPVWEKAPGNRESGKVPVSLPCAGAAKEAPECEKSGQASAGLERLENPVYVLFDYEQRDALTGNARVVVLLGYDSAQNLTMLGKHFED